MLNPSRPRGVTLIELVITLAVLGILIMLGLPSYSNWIANSQVRTAADSTLAGMQLARAEAIRRNTGVTFWLVNNLTSACTLTAAGPNWIISRNSPTGKCNVTPSETVDPFIIQSRVGAEGSPNVTIAADDGAAPAAGPATSVTFDGLGRVVLGGTWIRNINFDSSTLPAPATRALRITVDSGGRIRMCEPAVADATDTRSCS